MIHIKNVIISHFTIDINIIRYCYNLVAAIL